VPWRRKHNSSKEMWTGAIPLPHYNDKHFGLADIGQRGLKWNKTIRKKGKASSTDIFTIHEMSFHIFCWHATCGDSTIKIHTLI
jgi:hypothetical protein